MVVGHLKTIINENNLIYLHLVPFIEFIMSRSIVIKIKKLLFMINSVNDNDWNTNYGNGNAFKL